MSSWRTWVAAWVLSVAVGVACAQSTRFNFTLEELGGNIDQFWVLLTAPGIFFMQCGFLMVETGGVRVKNTRNIITMCMVTTCVSGLVWYMWGWALSFGSDRHDGSKNGFVGTRQFFLIDSTPFDCLNFFFQFTFQAATVMIVSGVAAERMVFHAWIIICFVVAGISYPFIAHWVWAEDGFLRKLEVVDFAGSGVVHMTGGFASLVVVVLLGAREGRFVNGRPSDIPGHSIGLVALGSLVLWYGWLSFNAGSTLGLVGSKQPLAENAAINTVLSPAAACLISLIYHKVHHREYIVPKLFNGLLAGAASITAPCGVVGTNEAILIGVLSSIFYEAMSELLLILKIDDPVDAVAVHASAGLWGVISVGLFGDKELMTMNYGFEATNFGLLMGGGWRLLGVQMLEAVCIIGWAVGTTLIVTLALKLVKQLRVDQYTEDQGLDKSMHAGYAYTSIQVKVSDYINIRQDVFG